MTRTFSNAKFVTALISNRGYATATEGVALRNGAPAVTLKKGSEESGKTSWVPDPVTGHYRPDKQPKETDPAELREMLVENKSKGH